MAAKNYVGKTLTIKAGTKVTRAGVTTKRTTDSQVTVRAQEIVRGKLRVYWKSNGVRNTFATIA